MAGDEEPGGPATGCLSFTAAEYGLAEMAFIWDAVGEVARRSHPLLAQIAVAGSSGPITSQYPTAEGEVIEVPPGTVGAEITLTADEIVAGRPSPLIDQIAAAAESHQQQLLTLLFGSISQVTEATGNQVDAEGRPFIDAFCELLERMEFQFDEDGNLAEGTTLVMHPETYARISANPENWTPEARARVEGILDRKREEFRARQRDRRIS